MAQKFLVILDAGRLVTNGSLVRVDTYHICRNRDWFSTYCEIDGGKVLMGNDAPCKVVGIGTIQIKMFDGTVRTLKDVRHVPELKKKSISLDLWGPSRVPSKGGARYMLTFIDDYSRRVWVYILKRKDEVFVNFKQWKTMIKKQTRKFVKRLRTNNGLEFCQGEFNEFYKNEVVRGTPDEPVIEDAHEFVDDNTAPKEAQPEEQHDLQSYSLARDRQRRNVFKKKEGIPGVEDERFKARLVANGFTQREGVDFNEVFSPVVKHSSIRMLLDMVALCDMELQQLDVKTAFLHGELEEKIYMRQPKGFMIQGKEDHACLLKKSLYGLKQSPRQWYKRFDIA
ncbi:retrovirus-related pol polyprotein from transposon TNT 1-94 [Tanacetum coccineum]